jgi:hypothetical protein
MLGQETGTEVGVVSVVTTNDVGLSAEHWTDRCLAQIIQVGENSHPLVIEQAKAFKEQIRKVILYYMKQAIKSDRTTLNGVLVRQGEAEMAKIIGQIKEN